MGFQPSCVAMTAMPDLFQRPQSERLALAITLSGSLDEQARDGPLPLDSALCAVLDRRWQAHLNNPASAVAWDEAYSQLGIG